MEYKIFLGRAIHIDRARSVSCNSNSRTQPPIFNGPRPASFNNLEQRIPRIRVGDVSRARSIVICDRTTLADHIGKKDEKKRSRPRCHARSEVLILRGRLLLLPLMRRHTAILTIMRSRVRSRNRDGTVYENVCMRRTYTCTERWISLHSLLLYGITF